MSIKDYYGTFKVEVCHNIDAALTDTSPIYPSIAKNRSFVYDYGQWIRAIDNRPETVIYKNAIRAYQEAFSNMLMGLYQPAFMGLRYFLERTLMGVYFSANELELRTWLAGNRDSYWTELIGEEGGDKERKDGAQNVNRGLFSLKFTRAFFEEFDKICLRFRSQTKNVYRECSEYVHGNPYVIQQLGDKMEYSEELSKRWNDSADTIARCILYAFMMRYWKSLSEGQKEPLHSRLREEFSTTDVIKEFIN